MKARVISGILGGLLLLFLTYAGGLWLAAGVGLLISLGVYELCQLTRGMEMKLSFPLLLGAGLIYLLFLVHPKIDWLTMGPLGWAGLALTIFIFIVLLRELLQGDLKNAFIKTGSMVLGLVYPSILLSYIILIRKLPEPYGLHLIFFTYLLTWGTDTGAYFVGITWGRHPLAPTISPKKSMEGAVGGLIIGSLAGIAYLIWAKLPLFPWALVAPLATIIGQLGDLFESLLKRGANIKDSGQFLPGHGGVLDRFDSMMFTAPFIYYLALVWLAGL